MKAFKPTKEWIENLTVGDFALNCFGRLEKVAKITYRGTNIHGKRFVGYHLDHGHNSTMSESSTEDSVQPTLALTKEYNRSDNVPANMVTSNVMECGK